MASATTVRFAFSSRRKYLVERVQIIRHVTPVGNKNCNEFLSRILARRVERKCLIESRDGIRIRGDFYWQVFARTREYS